MKKNLIPFLIGSLVIGSLFMPKLSSAFLGEGDTVFDVPSEALLGAIEGTGADQIVNSNMDIVKKYVLDGLAYSVAQKLSQKLVSVVLNKVNGGASQNQTPNFITNFGKYFSDISGKQVSDYTSTLYGSSNPFAKNISVGLVNSISGYANQGLSSFNLNKLVPQGTKWQDAASNISVAGKKGWDFYTQVASPQNNPIGASLIAQDQLTQKIKNAKDVAQKELSSSGFSPQKAKDLLVTASNYTNPDFLTKKTHDALQAQIDANQQAAANANQQATMPTDQTAGQPGSTISTTPSSGNFDWSGGTGTSVLGSDYGDVKLDAPVQSPQTAVASQVNDASAEASKRLQSADEFFKLLFSTLTQLAFIGVEGGIKAATSDAGQAPTATYGNPSTVAKIIAGTNGKPGNWQALPDQIIDFRNELEASTKLLSIDIGYSSGILKQVRKPVTGVTLDSQEMKSVSESDMNKILAGEDPLPPPGKGTQKVLQKLEQCIPGPDTGWDQRLRDFVSARLKETRGRAGDDSKGPPNSKAIAIINRQTEIAIQETKSEMQDPLVTMPGQQELQSIASGYYKYTKTYLSEFDKLVIKRQTLSRLNSIMISIKSLRDNLFANDTVKPPMFDSEWQALSTTERKAMYDKLSPAILADFPNDYGTPTGDAPLPADVTSTTTVNELMAVKLSPLSTTDPDKDMEKRVIDEVWHQWETDTTTVTEKSRQLLYQQYVSVKDQIPTAKSVQQDQSRLNGLIASNTEVADAYQDCLTIRQATKDYAVHDAAHDWDAVKKSLILDRVRNVFNPASSIITSGTPTADHNLFWKEKNRPIDEANLPGNADDFAAYITMADSGTSRFQAMLQRINAGYSSGSPSSPSTSGSSTSSSSIPVTITNAARYTDQRVTGVYQENYTGEADLIPADVPVVTGLPIREMQILPARTPADFLAQDKSKILFCKLSNYHLVYWLPGSLTGEPIGCEFTDVAEYGGNHDKQSFPDFYDTNVAEIFYQTDGVN